MYAFFVPHALPGSRPLDDALNAWSSASSISPRAVASAPAGNIPRIERDEDVIGARAAQWIFHFSFRFQVFVNKSRMHLRSNREVAPQKPGVRLFAAIHHTAFAGWKFLSSRFRFNASEKLG